MKLWALVAALMVATPSTATAWHKNIRMEGVFTDLGYLHLSSPLPIVEVIDVQGDGLEMKTRSIKTLIGGVEEDPNIGVDFSFLSGVNNASLFGSGDDISSSAILYIHSDVEFWAIYYDESGQLYDAFVRFSQFATFINLAGDSYLNPFINGTYYDERAGGPYNFYGFTVTATASLINLKDHSLSAQPFYSISYNKLVISDVPEPGTWAIMLGGFGMIGGVMRYGRRSSEGRSGILSARNAC